MINSIKHFLFSLLVSLCAVGQAIGQTAAILPPGVTQFFDNNGNPLSGGRVYFYIPATLTFKTTWQDSAETIPNTNPIVLDAGGKAIIYGQGSYRQIVRKANADLVWDALTSSTGSGSSGTGATGDGDLVGTIKPWGGLSAPNQYAFAYGQELNRTTYATLFTAITQITTVTCASGSPIISNISDTTQIPIGGFIELSCVAAGTTVVSKTALTVTLSANSSLSTSASATFFLYGRGNGSTTFNLPDLRGRVVAGRDNMGGIAAARLGATHCAVTGTGTTCGLESKALTAGNLASHTHTSSTLSNTAHTHGLTPLITAATASFTGTQAAAAGTTGAPINVMDWTNRAIVTGAATTTSSQSVQVTISANTGANSSGLSTAFSLVQPTMQLNYIIKITPDTASSVSTGVTSLQSMIGDIACGDGLLCTGNIISATALSPIAADSLFGNATGAAAIPTAVPLLSCSGVSSALTYNISTHAFGCNTIAGAAASGSDTQIQFNSAGVFGASANLTWVSPALSIGAAGVGISGQLKILGTTSGTVTQTVQAAAGTPTVTWGTSTGTPVVTASAPLAITAATGNIVVTGAAGQVLGGATPAFTATPTLGASGTLGTIAFGNATSGTITLSPVTGALGTVTLSLPAATDTLVGKATTDTFTNKTFDTAGTGNSFSIASVAVTANTGTGAVARATSPAFTTPNIGVATATSINGNFWTTGTGTLTIAAGKTFTLSNTLTFVGTDGNSYSFPSISDVVATVTANQTLTNKTLTSPVINGGTATALTGLAIRSTGSGFDLTFVNTEILTAGRNLTLTVNNANRTIDLSGNLTIAAGFTTSGGNPITLTSTGSTGVTLPTSGTLAAIDIAQTFSGTNIFSALTQFTNIKLSGGLIYPTSDGTTALSFAKADGATRILNVDTTNSRIGINKTPGAFDLDVNATVNVGTTLTFGTLSATSLAASTSTITGLTVNNSPSAANDYFLYFSAADAAIRKCTVGSCTAAGVAGVSSLNGLTGGLSLVAGTNAGLTVTSAVSSITYGIDGAFGYRNRIINPNGQVNQANPTTITDGLYDFDQWVVLVQTAAVASSQVLVAENSTPFLMRLTQSQAVAQRMGRIQWIERDNILDLRGQVATCSARVRLSTTDNIRMAIVEWTGTADTITKDIVNTWTSTTYTTGNFFTTTSTVVTAVSSSLALTANSFTTVSVSGTVGSTMNNLSCFLWTENAVAQNVTFDVSKVQLEQSSSYTPLAIRPFGTEIELCQRYYEKTFDMATVPAQAAGISSGGAISSGASGTIVTQTWMMKVRKRVAPTIVTYNPTQANANWRSSTDTGDATVSVDVIGESNVILTGTSATDAVRYRVHLTANARL